MIVADTFALSLASPVEGEGITGNRRTLAHPWHDLPIGDRAPDEFLGVVEIPKGGKVKYELDKQSGLLWVDRVLYSSVMYPANYGFIPQTYGDDGDPLDFLALMQEPVVPLATLRLKPIGMMQMLDQGLNDEKIICVHMDDPEYNGFSDISELQPHRLAELRRFFQDYKALENKEVLVQDFLGPSAAKEAVKAAMANYQRDFGGRAG